MNNDIISALANEIAKQVRSPIPVEVDLWDAATIAQFLKVKPAQVLERYACLPSFPNPIRLPTPSGGNGHPRWKAAEVISWALKHQTKRRVESYD